MALDSDQQAAADHQQGPACVAAAAGSGKTTLLVARAVQLVERGSAPASVVTLCFNANAAETLRERLKASPATRGWQDKMAGTFHAFGRGCLQLVAAGRLKVLQKGAKAKKGVTPAMGGPRLEDADMTAREMQESVWARLRGDEFRAGKLRKPQRREWPEWMQAVEAPTVQKLEETARERMFDGKSLHQELLEPGRQADLLKLLQKMQLPDASDDTLVALSHYMPAFAQSKAACGYIDYLDMLVQTVNLLMQDNYKVKSRLAEIKHLQIDEAQDGSLLRWYIAYAHATLRADGSTMAVGDMRQSIAGFAGAQPAHFQKWWDHCAAEARFALPRNYRSAALIVESGNVIARGESWNLGGDSIAAMVGTHGQGNITVGAFGAFTLATRLAREINEGTIPTVTNAEGQPVYDLAILGRTHAALEAIDFAFRTHKIRTKRRGRDKSAWEANDGRCLRALLSLPDGVIPSVPVADGKWFPDHAGTAIAVNALDTAAHERGQPGWASEDLMERWSTIVKQPDAEGVMRSTARLDTAKIKAAATHPTEWKGRDTARFLQTLLKDFGGMPDWTERINMAVEATLVRIDLDTELALVPGREGERGEVVAALENIARQVKSPDELTQSMRADLAPLPPGVAVVELSTIHGAKGNQWGTVAVVGVEEGILPHARAVSPTDEAEELRLLYVAVTRPVHTLIVDVTPGPSRFDKKLAALKRLANNGGGQGPVDPPPEPPAPKHESMVPFKQHEPEPRSEGVMTQTVSAPELIAQLEDDEERAEELTEMGVKPQGDSRFVPVRWSELQELLRPHGFAEDVTLARRANQRVLSVTLKDGAQALVYTSVPPGADVARSLGEDSMKVVVLDPKGKPYARRQPYAARTRNWRVTLLKRIVEALQAHPDTKAD